jgi:hypothetical protein
VNKLWTALIDCAQYSRKLVPVGEYLPGMKEIAVFHVE